MKKEIFDDVVEGRIEKIRSLFLDKGAEYASGGDRLYNFREAARMRGITMAKALDGMMLKHVVSVNDLIKFPKTVNKYLINEKIGDHINYLILLEAVLLESLDNTKE